jgi:hypothetical protein
MIPIEITFRLPDGKVLVLHQEAGNSWTQRDPEDPYGSLIFWWTDGNAGCDCNRAIWLNHEYNLDLPEECGETITLLKLVIDGKDMGISEDGDKNDKNV